MSATLTQSSPSAGDTLALLAQLQCLAMPQTAVRCLETVSAPDPSEVAEQLCEVIASDPPLAARLLGVANSAFFALPRPIFELRSAILNVLGLDLARNLALSMAMNDCFDVRRCQPLDLRRYWTTALLTAHLAADRSSLPPGHPPPPGAPELCGLLRTLGLLALAHVAPIPVGEALRRAATGQPLASSLHVAIGIDHRQALDLIVGRWKLPPLISEVCGAAQPGSVHGTLLRPLIERAHERARTWWEVYQLGIADDGEAPFAAHTDGSRPGSSHGRTVGSRPSALTQAVAAAPATDLSPAQYGAAERLYTMVESCVPMH